MNDSGKKLPRRIAASAALLCAAFAVEDARLALTVYATAYLTAGFDVLARAARNIAGKNIFDENFLMTAAGGCPQDFAGTAVHVSIDGEYRGCITVADEVKESVPVAVHRLKQMASFILLTSQRSSLMCASLYSPQPKPIVGMPIDTGATALVPKSQKS